MHKPLRHTVFIEPGVTTTVFLHGSLPIAHSKIPLPDANKLQVLATRYQHDFGVARLVSMHAGKVEFSVLYPSSEEKKLFVATLPAASQVLPWTTPVILKASVPGGKAVVMNVTEPPAVMCTFVLSQSRKLSKFCEAVKQPGAECLLFLSIDSSRSQTVL